MINRNQLNFGTETPVPCSFKIDVEDLRPMTFPSLTFTNLRLSRNVKVRRRKDSYAVEDLQIDGERSLIQSQWSSTTIG